MFNGPLFLLATGYEKLIGKVRFEFSPGLDLCRYASSEGGELTSGWPVYFICSLRCRYFHFLPCVS